MGAPKRVQMTRQKPWRAENPDAVIVARPSKYGNPWRVQRSGRDGQWDVIEHFEDLGDVEVDYAGSPEAARSLAVQIFRDIIAEQASDEPPTYPSIGDIRAELAGKDLACWCPLDQPCHADVLLSIANGTDR